jgi:hypothetical protein
MLAIGNANKIVINHLDLLVSTPVDGEKDKKVISHLLRTTIIGESNRDIKVLQPLMLVAGEKTNILINKLMIQAGDEVKILLTINKSKSVNFIDYFLLIKLEIIWNIKAKSNYNCL